MPYAIYAQNVVTATTAMTAMTATMAITGTTATTATNTTHLGGIPAANFLTGSSNFGQSVTTVYGTNQIIVNDETNDYTLIPGLTQTGTAKANSSLMISTDGGFQSTGTVGTSTVVDVAVFVDRRGSQSKKNRD